MEILKGVSDSKGPTFCALAFSYLAHTITGRVVLFCRFESPSGFASDGSFSGAKLRISASLRQEERFIDPPKHLLHASFKKTIERPLTLPKPYFYQQFLDLARQMNEYRKELLPQGIAKLLS